MVLQKRELYRIRKGGGSILFQVNIIISKKRFTAFEVTGIAPKINRVTD